MIPSVHNILSSAEVEGHINEAVSKIAPFMGRVNMPVTQPAGIVNAEWLANNIGQLRMANFVLKIQLTLLAGLVDYMIQQPYNVCEKNGYMAEYEQDAVNYAKGLVNSIVMEYEQAIKMAQEKSKIVLPNSVPKIIT